MSRFSFKKNLDYDLALLSEVESLNPYSVPKKKAKPIWEEICRNLTDGNLNMAVTARSCRERVESLLKEFRAEEQLSIKSSGVEEDELKRVTYLLTSISKLEDGQKDLKPGIRKLYSKKARVEAEEVRSNALSEINEEDLNEADPDDPDKSESNEQNSELETPPLSTSSASSASRKRQTGGTELISYLKSKNEAEINFKREELEVRKTEAENKKLELSLAKERQDAELEEKRRMTQLLFSMVQKNQ